MRYTISIKPENGRGNSLIGYADAATIHDAAALIEYATREAVPDTNVKVYVSEEQKVSLAMFAPK